MPVGARASRRSGASWFGARWDKGISGVARRTRRGRRRRRRLRIETAESRIRACTRIPDGTGQVVAACPRSPYAPGGREVPRGTALALPAAMSTARLLIVDDEALITFSMRRYFVAQGFEVDCAAELLEAEGLVARTRYDAVIADLRLSGQGSAEGLELIAFVRERCPTTRTILLTSYGSPEVEAAARSRGAHAVILKPKSLPDLAQVVVSLLEEAGAP